ncbi:MAG: hypothetical protein ACC661_08810, partial [Verrucomicrobiales bacterium]
WVVRTSLRRWRSVLASRSGLIDPININYNEKIAVISAIAIQRTRKYSFKLKIPGSKGRSVAKTANRPLTTGH